MNYGIQISASGAMTAMYRQDVFSNNLANGTTVGFKPDIPAARQRDSVRVEDGLEFMPSNELLERLGGGLQMMPNRTKFEQGSLESSSSSLDLAIQGEGFFVVRDDRDASGNTLRMTRDGRFTKDATGRIVSAASGMPLLDTNSRPIKLNDTGPVTIDNDGTVHQDGKAIAQIQFTAFPDNSKLIKRGDGVFIAPSNTMSSRRPASGVIKQYSVEGSAVDEVSSIMQITGAGRDFESNMNMIAAADRMSERAINTFGRVT